MSAAFASYQHLSLSERIQLVEDIWDSIASEAEAKSNLSQPKLDELARRAESHKNDPQSAIAWKDVREMLFKS
jgi:putative addiction module component (TIGR02574 family)